MKTFGDLPLKILKKVAASFLVVMLLFMIFGVGAGTTLAMTSDYRGLIIQDSSITIAQTLLYDKTCLSLQQELENKGYKVVSAYINADKLFAAVSSKNVRTEPIDYVKNSAEATVAAIVIKINNQEYLFKNETDTSALVKILEENNINYEKEEREVNYKELTKPNLIDEAIDKVKKEVEEKKARAVAAAISRSSTDRTKYNRNEERTTDAVLVNASPVVNYKYISSSYGYRHGKLHTGIDLASNYGTKVKAWKAGIVTYAGWNGNYGNFITVQHYDNTISRYAHLSNYAIAKGDAVDQGQVIGYVGSTGNSTRSTFALGSFS